MQKSRGLHLLQPLLLLSCVCFHALSGPLCSAVSVYNIHAPDNSNLSSSSNVQQETQKYARVDSHMPDKPDATTSADVLLDWFKANGGVVTNLVMDVGEGGKGGADCEQLQETESINRQCDR